MTTIASDLPQHYALLGLPPDAAADAIKRAWKRAATRWHPDLTQGIAHPRFDAVREAWDVLGDPNRRAAYDAALQASVDRAVEAMNRLHGVQRIGGVVSRFVGVRGGSPEPGRNRRLRLSVGFGQAVRGAKVDVELAAEARCDACDATGAAPSGRTWVCGACGGIGEVLAHGMLRSGWGRCGSCRGLGWVPEPACGVCAGSGTVAGVEKLWVTIPAGTRSGQTLRVSGAGEPSLNGGVSGDLLIEVDVRPDAFLTPAGNDVRCDRPVPFWLALAGGRIEVPTLEGSARIAIPSGTRSGDVLRMPGWGLDGAGGRGDQLVTVRVEWPAGLDQAAAEALRAWAASVPPDVFPETVAFEARVAASAGARQKDRS